jgi:chromosome segregation ATPase
LTQEKKELETDITILTEDISKWELLKLEYINQITSYTDKTIKMKREIDALNNTETELRNEITKIES